MASHQAQIATALRTLRSGLDDGRNVTWEADQALRRMRGSLHRARGAGVPLGGVDALLAGAMESVTGAERARQSGSAAVADWLALHDAAASGGGAAGAGGAVPSAGGWSQEEQAREEHLVAFVIAPFGAVPAAAMLIDMLGENWLAVLAPGAVGAAVLVRFVAGELAQHGFDWVIRRSATRLAGTAAVEGGTEPAAVVTAVGIVASGVLAAAGAPLWVVASGASVVSGVGWTLEGRRAGRA